MIKEKYYVEKIENKKAEEIVIKNHYLHRKCSASYSFGIFEKSTDKILGCVVFGIPASRFLQKGICGNDEADNVIELTRLWIDDQVEKNGESYLVSQGLKYMKAHKVKTDIVVSFSDTGAGHLGYIYQASNFYYTGTNHMQKDWVVDGRKEHNRHFIDRFGSVKQAKEYYGDRMVQVERTVKHRYVYFNCDKKRKKELLHKLKYEIKEYPKIINEKEVINMSDEYKESLIKSIELPAMIDILKLKEKEPELFDDLTKDYPLTKGDYLYKVV